MLSLFIVPLVVATLPPQFHLASCVGPTDASDMRSRLSGVVEAALKRGDIPGVALSIVNRTSVLVEAGYGAANASSGRRMDADTLLPLGSTTKAFTSALLALLIDKYATDDKHRLVPRWYLPRAGAHVLVTEFRGMALSGLFCVDVLRATRSRPIH